MLSGGSRCAMRAAVDEAAVALSAPRGQRSSLGLRTAAMMPTWMKQRKLVSEPLK
jgi:hypothetical protein